VGTPLLQGKEALLSRGFLLHELDIVLIGEVAPMRPFERQGAIVSLWMYNVQTLLSCSHA